MSSWLPLRSEGYSVRNETGGLASYPNREFSGGGVLATLFAVMSCSCGGACCKFELRHRMAAMPLPSVTFEPVSLASMAGCEKARLMRVDGHVAGILVRLTDLEGPTEDKWYLEVGFGPWNREGLAFPNLRAAKAWVQGQLRAKKDRSRTLSEVSTLDG